MSLAVTRLAELRDAHGEADGLGLLRSTLKGEPFRGRTALVSSFGSESAVLLDMVASVDRHLPVIFLDTFKLFDETHVYREELTGMLGLTDVRIVRPERVAVERYDPDGALWTTDPDFCCHIRKTEPLEDALSGFDAWITGRKRFQGNLRAALPTVEGDVGSGRIKLNPLARWSAEDVERYRLLRGLPAHPLVEHGFRSIGCTTCTRPTKPGEDARAGRWRGLDKTECGIHGAGI